MSMKTLLNVLTIFSLGTLTGCDYIEKASLIDDLAKQQELQKSKIEELEKQQEQYKNKAELFEKQQNNITNSTSMGSTARESAPNTYCQSLLYLPKKLYMAMATVAFFAEPK